MCVYLEWDWGKGNPVNSTVCFSEKIIPDIFYTYTWCFFPRFLLHFLSCFPIVVLCLFEKWRSIHKVSPSMAKNTRSFSNVCVTRN